MILIIYITNLYWQTIFPFIPLKDDILV